jgi:lactoylglutathione lyase
MTTMPRPAGLFETHLTVADLDGSVAFYRDVVGLHVGEVVRDRGAAFLWVGRPGDGMLGLWSLGSAPMGLSLHIAFEVSLADVRTAGDSLRAAGVTPLSFFGAETSEPSVIGWMPAAAVYFRDPDGHLIEYLAMLPDPPRPELGVVSWSTWAGRDGGDDALRIEQHTGPRTDLRALFEEAEDSTSALDAYIDAGDVLVASVNGRVVGHLQLIEGEHNGAEIKNMAVEAAYRGRGIGRTLIAAAIEAAVAAGHARLSVATAAADVDNLRFYQLAGFRLRSVERDAFTRLDGYAAGLRIDGIPLRDRVWLELDLDPDLGA